jgi:hypothetical protein
MTELMKATPPAEYKLQSIVRADTILLGLFEGIKTNSVAQEPEGSSPHSQHYLT